MSVPADAEQAAAQRDKLERLALVLMLAAVASHASGEHQESQAARERARERAEHRLVQAAAALAKAVVFSYALVLERMGVAPPPQRELASQAERLASELEHEARVAVAQKTSELRAHDPPLEPEELTAQQQNWAKMRARTEGTRRWSEQSESVARHLGEDTPSLELQKLWVSRGDSKVRKLHRHLHASTAELDKPFWRWPSTGQQLRYPGDLEAPLDQTMGCRCVLLLVKTEDLAQVPEAFELPLAHFVP